MGVVVVPIRICSDSDTPPQTSLQEVAEEDWYLSHTSPPPEAFHAHGMLCMRCHASGLPSVKRAECMRMQGLNKHILGLEEWDFIS